MNEHRRTGFAGDLGNACRGLLMGGADIIPGVSGGTVALILGIYERLVTAISHFDLVALGHARRREWAAAARHVDLRFLVALGCGIAVGIGGLATLMNHLLEHYPIATWSLLFGLILASSVLVATMVAQWNALNAVAAVAGAAFAYWLVALLPAVPPAGYGYLFLCGTIAICAMILPGISGAFILVLLGKYFDITAVLRDLLHGRFTADNVLTVLVFVSGCAVGLLSFSKFLRWLLTVAEATTMAVLCGFMFGSLRKIWPFKTPLDLDDAHSIGLSPESVARFQEHPAEFHEMVAKFRLGENHLPQSFDREVLLALAMTAIGMAIVFILDRLTRTSEHVPPLEEGDHEPR